MRELKFRAFYGGKMHGNEEAHRLMYNNTAKADIFHTDAVIMQFTGWVRGGKEVYVGDIVRVNGTKRKGNYLTQVIETNYGFSIKENHTYLIGTAISQVIMEVVGNIHENLELLTNEP